MKRIVGRRAQKITRLILARENYVCHLCGFYGADTIDHLLPLADGGGYTHENLRAAHRSCNSRRSAERTNAMRRAWTQGQRNSFPNPRVY
jgi:5-methylcytosine-specific restriction endonuclease McrA